MRCSVVVVVCLAALLACSSAPDPSAPVVTVVGPAGGRVVSTDGAFWLEVPPGALAEDTELSIARRRDLLADDLTSAIYEVGPADVVFARPAVARLASSSSEWIGRRALATFDSGAAEEVPTGGQRAYDRTTHVASGELTALVRRRFGLLTRVEEGGCAAATCGTPCAGCDPSALGCMPDPDGPVCSVDGRCAAPEPLCPAQGWRDLPATGRAFVVSSLAVADFQRGFDLDGRCRAPGDCIDNSVHLLGRLGNDHLRQALLGGEHLLLIEVAGLDAAGPAVSDGSVTVKWYEGRDADEPFFPANNFSLPAGETTCCEFVVHGESLSHETGNARSRIPARISRGILTSTGSAVDGPTTFFPIRFAATSTAPAPVQRRITLQRARVSARLGVDEIADGLLGGVLAAAALARTANPFCETLDAVLCQRHLPHSTLLDLFLAWGPPDMDLDGDGLETVAVGASGFVEGCVDGDGTPVPPVDPDRASSCLDDPRMVDGYSIAFTFSGVAAIIRGTTGAP